MNLDVPHVRDLILVGGGHSNIHVLKYFGMNDFPGVRLTLISSQRDTPYSGMLPGLVANIYETDQLQLNLERLCQFADARFIRAEVIGIDSSEKRIVLKDRPALGYDLLSLNVGAIPEVELSGALPVKPISVFLATLKYLDLNVRSGSTLTIVGSGAAGVELSLSFSARYSQRLKINLIGNELLGGDDSSVSRKVQAELCSKNINFSKNKVIGFSKGMISLEDGSAAESDFVVQATGVVAPTWISSSGLDVDKRGFLKVNHHLQSISNRFIFAAGDVACLEGQERPKSGVFAVRAGKVLARNLFLALANKKLKIYRAQKQQLALINCCDGSAIAIRGGLALKGKIWWLYKDFVDRSFMKRFTDLALMNSINLKIPDEYKDEIPAHAMRCNGCGAKLAADPLKRVLCRIDVLDSREVELGIGDDAARIKISNEKLLITVDGFRSLVSDPYLFGRIAAHHSLNDIFAMGAVPKVALCLATIPYMSEKLMEEDLFQLLSGVNDVLKEHGVALVGGHTAEGAETSLGLTVTGAADSKSLEKNGASEGDILLLTKSIGSGVILAGAAAGISSPESINHCFGQMDRSNSEGMHVFLENGASAMTDVTGYGLIGHLSEMLRASSCGATVNVDSVGLMKGSELLIDRGIESSLQKSNELSLLDFEFKNGLKLSAPKVKLLVDPQTAGGLLAAVPRSNSGECLRRLKDLGYEASVVGQIEEEKVWVIQ